MISFFANSGIVTIIVISWLSMYFIATFWVFFYKLFAIKNIYVREETSLEMILSGRIKYPKSAVFNNLKGINKNSREVLTVWKSHVMKSASAGIVFLSIVSSTAPFIGLFGTVVEILEAFSKMGGAQATFDVISPVISKALVATAFGISTSIPAYSFYYILKRKLLDISICLESQIDLCMSIGDEDDNDFKYSSRFNAEFE